MSINTPQHVEILDGEWECMDCGYIEEGVSARRPTACPECGAAASVFEFFENEDWEDDDWEDEDWEDEDEPDYSSIMGYDEDGPIFEDELGE